MTVKQCKLIFTVLGWDEDGMKMCSKENTAGEQTPELSFSGGSNFLTVFE